MNDLINVVKETTKQFTQKYPVSNEIPFTQDQLQELKKIAITKYLKQPYSFKNKYPYKNYTQMIMLYFQHKFTVV